ncbi:class I SAM-dependent methyltransferase [Flavitalea flava]
MKRLLKSVLIQRLTDLLLSPITLFSAIWFKYISTATARQMPISEKIFMAVGVLPFRDHYYQPLINPSKHLSRPLHEPRILPGIFWNTEEQLSVLGKFSFAGELQSIPLSQKDAVGLQFYLNNPSLCPSDAEFLYNMVRLFKPRKFIEIGCGYSTRMALQAEKKNREKDNSHTCSHICIEPYEMPWLEQLDVRVIRSKVEDLPLTTFSQLEANDILFIDSSHMIRPQGDVLFEFLQILPSLKSGVLVHVHDVFSPRDYPKDWIIDKHCQWNEQYLLEAFLSCNDQFRILGAVNLLKKEHRTAFENKCPNSASRLDDEPGSFWIIKK